MKTSHAAETPRAASVGAPETAHEIVEALVGASLLDPASRVASVAVVSGVLDAPRRAGGTRPPVGRGLPKLVEVVAYLGGALVLAAGALFLVQEWETLGFTARVTLLGVVTAVLAVAGAVVSRVPAGAAPLRDPAQDLRRRLAGTLLTGAALAVAFLVGHVVDELTDPQFPAIYWPAVAGAAAGVLVAAVGYRFAPTAAGVAGMLAGLVTVTVTLVNDIDTVGSDGDAIGVALTLLGVGFLVITELRWFRELTVARALGVALALFGAQLPVMDGTHAWLGYALTAAVVVAGIALYLGKVDWPYLAVAVIAVTLVVPEAIADWTEGSLGAVGGVLVAGVTLLVASFAGYRLRGELHEDAAAVG